MRRRSSSRLTEWKNPSGSPATTGASICPSWPSIHRSRSGVIEPGSPKRAPIWVRSAPAMRQTRCACGSKRSCRASRKLCTSRSSEGSFLSRTHSWNEPHRIGRIRMGRLAPRRYWRKTTWSSMECSVRWAMSSTARVGQRRSNSWTKSRSVRTGPSGVSKSFPQTAKGLVVPAWAVPRMTNSSASVFSSSPR